MATKTQLAAYLKLSIPGLNTRGSIGRVISLAIKENWSQNQLVLAVYKSPAFKARFPGISTAAGELLMSPREYLNRERELKNTMREFGLGRSWLNKPDDFAGFIMRGIGADQLRQRLEMSQQLLRNNPQIVDEIRRVFGGGVLGKAEAKVGALAWMMNPKRGTQYLEQIVTAAQISLSARQAGFNVPYGVGDERFWKSLAGRGVTGQQAAAAFAQAGPDLAQFKTLQARYQDRGAKVTDQQFAAALFAPDPKLEGLRKNLIAQEQAQFRQSSSFAQSGARGISGLQTDEAEDSY